MFRDTECRLCSRRSVADPEPLTEVSGSRPLASSWIICSEERLIYLPEAELAVLTHLYLGEPSSSVLGSRAAHARALNERNCVDRSLRCSLLHRLDRSRDVQPSQQDAFLDRSLRGRIELFFDRLSGFRRSAIPLE